MSWPLFCKIIDEAGPHIKEFLFFNYGEPFIHPRALEMLAYVRKTNPAIKITTSTNGILLARPGMAERIIDEGLIDRICFTIGGCDQETYKKYHKSGSFFKAMEGMRRLASEKRIRNAKRPIIYWRYLMFDWNDSDEHVAEALRLKNEIGVDEFEFMLSHTPMEGLSLRRAPGTAAHTAIEKWISYQAFYKIDPYFEAGLWGMENDAQFGRVSWTGRRARVNAIANNGRVLLKLARPALPMPFEANVTLQLPWGNVSGAVGAGDWASNLISIPANLKMDTVPISIVVSETFSPFRLSGLADQRDLGVMVSLEGVGPSPNPYRN